MNVEDSDTACGRGYDDATGDGSGHATAAGCENGGDCSSGYEEGYGDATGKGTGNASGSEEGYSGGYSLDPCPDWKFEPEEDRFFKSLTYGGSGEEMKSEQETYSYFFSSEEQMSS